MSLNGKDGEISALSARLQIMQYEADKNSASQHDQPFSAGINQSVLSPGARCLQHGSQRAGRNDEEEAGECRDQDGRQV